ncbi:MAG: carbohydrate porin [Planctomycetota bacterium]|nr:carbohydrate porin [Planctomycetota bacterium]
MALDSPFAACLLAMCIAQASPHHAPSSPPKTEVDPESVPTPDDPGAAGSSRERLTGDWWGARTSLESAGVDFGGEYILEWTDVASGGLHQDDSFRNLLSLDVRFDLERLLGMTGASAYLQYLSVNAERGGSFDAGDIQIFSNIEVEESLDALYEMWWEQRLFDDRIRIKLGKLDANTEFAAAGVADRFSNSSAGYSPTIFVLPTYPDSAFSANIFVEPVDGYTIGYGFYDGAAGVDGVPTGRRGPSTFFSDKRSDDYFHILEGAAGWNSAGSLGGGVLKIGGWLHTGDFERFDGGFDDDTLGFYALFEQKLLHWATAQDEGGLYMFAQYGWADQQVSDFRQHIAGGLVALDPFGRDGDSTGVYLSYADLSDVPAAGYSEDEFVVDAYYRLQTTPFAFIQPEIQWIVNPSGNPDIDDALVLGVRVGIEF